MKTRLLIIIGIIIILVASSSFVVLTLQQTSQQCELLGGKIAGLFSCSDKYPTPNNESKTASDCRMIFGKGTTEMYDCLDKIEPSDGIFYQRYHISIYQNTKTMEQYVTPDFITIGTNSQVTWSNYDDVTVSLNSIDPDNMWSTTVISPEGYDTVTFEKTGIFEYRGNSGIHGIIVVMDDDELFSDMFGNVFRKTSPLIYKETSEPVLLYDNCGRYAYWLTENQKEKIDLYEDYPRYPPWGNQIFPLVDFCITNGDLVKTVDDQIHWEFQLENEN